MESLGSELKKAREKRSLTLRQVEEVSGISNAYLSQLENDKIKKPSANILYKLAEVYTVEFNHLLKAAGIITAGEKNADNEMANSIAFYADKLSENDQKEVLNYIKYFIAKKDDR